MRKAGREPRDLVNSRVFRGSLGIAEEKGHRKNISSIIRHKNALKMYLVEGIRQILEHQQ